MKQMAELYSAICSKKQAIVSELHLVPPAGSRLCHRPTVTASGVSPQKMSMQKRCLRMRTFNDSFVRNDPVDPDIIPTNVDIRALYLF